MQVQSLWNRAGITEFWKGREGRIVDGVLPLNARLDSRPPSRYFANRTVAAAWGWRFQPSRVAEEWLLRFQLMRTQTKVLPIRVR